MTEMPTELNELCDEIEDLSQRLAEALAAQLRAQAQAHELRARLVAEARRRIAGEEVALATTDALLRRAKRRALSAEIDRVRLQTRLDALMARKDVLLWTVAS
jgi:hypothetical protein